MSNCETPITPTMIKEYYFCPRALYLQYALGLNEPPTGSLEEGAATYQALHRREQKTLTFLRRTSLDIREKHLALHLYSPRLCLQGVLDALLILRDGTHIPAEIKTAEADKIPLRHYYQLTAYAILVEENYNTTVTKALAYYTLNNKLLTAHITSSAKRHIAKHTIPKIQALLQGPPPPPRPTPRCNSCGYRQHCRTA